MTAGPVADDGFGAARAAVAHGDAQEAMRQVREELRNRERPPAPDVIAAMAELVGAEELSNAAQRLATAPDDAHAMFKVGYALYDVGAADVAVPIFRELLQRAPGNINVIAEYAAALSAAGRNLEAAALLRQHREQITGQFVLVYTLAFESIVSGDLATAAESLPKLATPADEGQQQMRDRIAAMLRRAEAVRAISPLDDNDLRGWHFVITGGVLLGRAASGHDEGMNGRWAAVYDTYGNIHDGLRRALAVLDRWRRRPERIHALPDRSSQALGHAAAELLGAELRTWTSETREPGLVVAFDLGDVDDEAVNLLRTHRPGQPLYVHASCWTSPPNVAPDFVTMLHQHLIPAWGARMRMTMAGGKPSVENLPPDVSPADVLAAHILDSDPTTSPLEDLDTVADVVAFAEPLRDVAAGTADAGLREPFWGASPVTSGRFA